MPTPEEVLTIGFDLDITGALKDLSAFQKKMSTQMGAVTATVDKLSKAVKEDMAVPDAAGGEVSRSVADVTTHSPEAYRYYTEGLDLLWKHYWVETEAAFRKHL